MKIWYIYIYELISYLDKCVDRIHVQMFIEIRNIINDAESSNRYWSKQVDKVWDENYEHAINLNFSFEITDVNQNTFIIWDGNSNNDTWKIMYYEDRPPEFECGIFLSFKGLSFYLYVSSLFLLTKLLMLHISLCQIVCRCI